MFLPLDVTVEAVLQEHALLALLAVPVVVVCKQR
jgi:hypothetical protein